MSDRFVVVSIASYLEEYGEPSMEASGYMAFTDEDHFYVLVDTQDGNRIVGDDRCEPEDALLIRDFSWVADLVNRVHTEAYSAGVAAGSSQAVSPWAANAAQQLNEKKG